MWAHCSSRPLLVLAEREEGMHVQQCGLSDIKQERKLQFLQLSPHVKTVYLHIEVECLAFKEIGEIARNMKELLPSFHFNY